MRQCPCAYLNRKGPAKNPPKSPFTKGGLYGDASLQKGDLVNSPFFKGGGWGDFKCSE